MNNPNKKIIFSGVQPSGSLHIGNYLGAILQWVELQDQYNCIFCVVDYHAITVKQYPKDLAKKILDVVKIYLSSGINPKKSIIFQQSDVSAHTELAWILNCITRNSDLTKMTQFKDKTGVNFDKVGKALIKMTRDQTTEKISKNIKKLDAQYTDEILEGINFFRKNAILLDDGLKTFQEQKEKFNKVGVGLYDYPVLMASDILLYNTDLVPVGEDQQQHVELCRTLARRFNNNFTETFKIPEVKIKKESARIMGLDDPTKKMSKSASSPANYIALTDEPTVAKKKIMRAVTDSGKKIIFDQDKKPAISNLLTIYSLLSGKNIKTLETQYENKGYGDFKKDLAEVTAEFLTKFQKKFNSFSDDKVKKILKAGAEKVKPIAEETLKKVKEKIGVL